MEEIFIAAVVFLAVLYLLSRARASFTPRAGSKGCGSCGCADKKKFH